MATAKAVLTGTAIIMVAVMVGAIAMVAVAAVAAVATPGIIGVIVAAVAVDVTGRSEGRRTARPAVFLYA